MNSELRTQNSELRTQNKRIKHKAFTLVEIIFVIAIIGILASFLLPGFNKIKQEAHKVQDMANLKKIAEAYKQYTEQSGRMMTFNGIRIAESLAWGPVYGYGDGKNLTNINVSKSECLLNDSGVYISPGDKYASKVVRSNIGVLKANGTYQWVQPWANNAPVLGHSNTEPLFSYVLIGGLDKGCPSDTTPVAFTRGLTRNGTWDKDYGLYGESGGYVAYLDGHIHWFDGKRPAKFLKYDKSGYSTNIADAVPDDASFSLGHFGPGDGNSLRQYTNAKNEKMVYDGFATENR